MSLTRLNSPLLHCIPYLRLPASIVTEKSLTKNLTLAYIERRKNKRTNEQISQESPLYFTPYKSSLLHCIPSLRLLAFIGSGKSLTKKFTYLDHIYLELYNIKKGQLSLWPSFQAHMTQIWTCPRLHAKKDFDQFSWRLDQTVASSAWTRHIMGISLIWPLDPIFDTMWPRFDTPPRHCWEEHKNQISKWLDGKCGF